MLSIANWEPPLSAAPGLQTICWRAMISESFYWKSDLLKQAAALTRRRTQKRWPDAALARCEQTVMLGFYSVRKLIESGKLTDRVANLNINVGLRPATGEVVHRMNCTRISELYDWENVLKKTVSLSYLCNQVIHSYVFSLLFGEDDALMSVLVTSDRQRSKELLEVTIEEVISVFEVVGRDDVRSMSGEFDEARGDFIFTRT